MKVGIVGAGAVGTACMAAMAVRGSAREIVLVNRTHERARGAVADLQYGTVLGPAVSLRAGRADDLHGAAIVMITAGVNEKEGGATDRGDRAGRLRLLGANAEIYRDIVPRVLAAAPTAILLVITDPPDPLADVTRRLAGHDRVLSSGTFLDSLRFRFHLGRKLGVDPKSVEAQVVGEHGTSQVFLWSTARVAGTPFAQPDDFRREVEREVRFANISIIEGTGASQLGIGVAVARIAEMIGRDERAVVPIGFWQERYGVTLSLPARLGRDVPPDLFPPALTEAESRALDESAATLRTSLESIGGLRRGERRSSRRRRPELGIASASRGPGRGAAGWRASDRTGLHRSRWAPDLASRSHPRSAVPWRPSLEVVDLARHPDEHVLPALTIWVEVLLLPRSHRTRISGVPICQSGRMRLLVLG